jgi:hypothetical protein
VNRNREVRTGKVNRFPPAGTVNLLNPNIYFHIGLLSPKFKRFILYRLIYQWSLIYTSITYQQFLYIETIWVWHAFVWTIVVAWHALITYQQFLYIQKPYEFDNACICVESVDYCARLAVSVGPKMSVNKTSPTLIMRGTWVLAERVKLWDCLTHRL